MRTVIHLLAPQDENTGAMFYSAFLSQGSEASIHVVQRDGRVDIYDFYRREGRSRVQITTVGSIAQCGCP